jgi:hypothetical protein
MVLRPAVRLRYVQFHAAAVPVLGAAVSSFKNVPNVVIRADGRGLQRQMQDANVSMS